MSEPLSWEKWSTYPRNRYVEEAKAFSRPGSVKQMKAYFEAHFKRMAALKAAALLLEKANAIEGGAPDEPNDESEMHNYVSNIYDLACLHPQQEEAEDSGFVDNHNEDDPLYEEVESRELLKSTKVECGLALSSPPAKSWTDDLHKKRTPLRALINRELNRLRLISPVIKKIASSSKATDKDCSAPLRTPAKYGVPWAFVNVTKNAPRETPQTGKRRGAKSSTGRKTKTSFPIIPKSFCLRSANRVPRRNGRLEEKFNAETTENIQQQSKLKERRIKELIRLCQSFCFGAKLSSECSREKERQEAPTHKMKATDKQSSEKGRSRWQSTHPKAPRMSIRSKTRVKAENAPSHS